MPWPAPCSTWRTGYERTQSEAVTAGGLGAPIVVLVGPTASGKSDVAMAAAVSVPDTEIVSIDAMQVYRRMDIGTAKPSPAERAAVVHHGLDLCEPSERFTVADYQREVTPAVANVPGVALAVAGTGLYLAALLDDLALPGEWADVRAGLEIEADADIGALHRRLQRLDPVAAARMEPSNRRRIVRALEVCEGAGRPFSSFGPGLDRYPDHGLAMIGLRWPRPVLAARIEARVHHMFAAGLVDEVTSLLVEPSGLSPTARQALGYKELIDHIEGGESLATAVERIVVRTRQFASRQERWYRRDPRITWIDITTDAVTEAASTVIAAVRAAGARTRSGGAKT